MKIKDAVKDFEFVGSNFIEYFGDMEYIKSHVTLYSKEINRRMNDYEIIDEFNPGEIPISYIITESDLLSKINLLFREDVRGLFYARDKDGVLRSLIVKWSKNGLKIGAGPVDKVDNCNDNFYVFSLKPFESDKPSDTLPDELLINGVKYKKI